MSEHLMSLSSPSAFKTQVSKISQANLPQHISSASNTSAVTNTHASVSHPMSHPSISTMSDLASDIASADITSDITPSTDLTPTQPIPKKSQQIKTDKPRPHICTTCTRAFARLEHLKRHERSHTNEKPFQCAACGRCFARRDLVLRHQQKLHTDLPNIMRRNSKDGTDGPNMNNEHIIVLPNNTDANAALPGGGRTLLDSDKVESKHHKSVSTPGGLRAVFSENRELFPRHSSYSAALGTPTGADYLREGYRNSFSLIQEDPHLDLGFDWNHVDVLDLNHPAVDYNQFLFKKDFLEKSNYHPKTRLNSAPENEMIRLPHGALDPSDDYSLSPRFKPDKKRRLDDISPNGTPNSQTKELLDFHSLNQFDIDMGNMDMKNTPSSVNSNNKAGQPIKNGNIRLSHSPNVVSGTERDSIPDQGDWLQEIINTPYEPFLNQIDQPEATPKNVDEITNLFKTRQLDLSKHLQMELNLGDNLQDLDNLEGDPQAKKDLPFNLNLDSDQLGLNKDLSSDISYFKVKDFSKDSGNITPFINDELRDRIMVMSNLSDMQFPKVDELNNYMKLYEKEFNKYFPFIHLASLRNPMVDKFENIPLLLAMTSIGALYSYNDANTLLLFNLSKYHIQNFFEKEVTLDNLQFKKVPLMAHQCLVLHIFISMFLNEPPMIDITSRQMKSMVGLIKSTNFHKPLDKFLIPPKPIVHEKKDDNGHIYVEYDNDPVLVQNNFDYFIMAQSRIRTIFVFYMLQQVRTSTLLDLSVLLNGGSIMSGKYCSNEDLWRCENSTQWLQELTRMENKHSIVDLSNNGTIQELIDDLINFKPLEANFNNLLCLLIYVHERIQEQFTTMKQQQQKLHHNQISNFLKFDYFSWKMNVDILKNLIKSWEMMFVKNDGPLVINETNSHLLQDHSELKLILPMYHLAKIKISVNLTPIIERVVYKDWENMNNYLNHLHHDFEGLKELIEYSIQIMELWNLNIMVVNNSTENNLRTPVFFVTCVFISLLLISQFLYYIEQINDKDHGIQLGINEKILWLRCEKVLQTCEKSISRNYSQKNLFEEYENYESIRRLIETNSNSKLIVKSLKLIKLSNKCLFLGVRILADAPIWPLAMGFAEALKNRANYISKT